MFCQVTGLNGTTQRGLHGARRGRRADHASISTANVSPKLPWKFTPENPSDTIDGRRARHGVLHRHQHVATSRSPAPRPSTSRPAQAGKYFTKIQCFCFTAADAEARRDGAHAGDLLRRSQDARPIPTRATSRRSRCPTRFTRWIPAKARKLERCPTSHEPTGKRPMAGAKNHDYHILPPSIWPLFGVDGGAGDGGGRHHVDARRPRRQGNGGGWVFLVGLAGRAVHHVLAGGRR